MMKILGAAITAVAMVTSAHAGVTVTAAANGPDVLPSNATVIYDFDTLVPTTGPTGQLQGDYGIVSGDLSGVYAAPLGDGSKYLTVPLAKIPGTASLELGKGYTNLSFYWGSIDKYNSVSFYSNDEFLGTIGSADIPAVGDGSTTSPANNRRVSFSFGGKAVDTLVISSRQYAFELDTIATTNVPEPSTWAMLIAGMGLVGVSMRRRRVITSVTA